MQTTSVRFKVNSASFNETFTFSVYSDVWYEELLVEAWDQDLFTADDIISRGRVKLDAVMRAREVKVLVPLSRPSDGNSGGKLGFDIFYFLISKKCLG